MRDSSCGDYQFSDYVEQRPMAVFATGIMNKSIVTSTMVVVAASAGIQSAFSRVEASVTDWSLLR
jgi:hypothetical protein